MATLRRLVRRGIEQLRRGKPIAPPKRDKRGIVPTYSADTVVMLPDSLGEDADVIRAVGDEVARINLDSAKQELDRRLSYFGEKILEIAASFSDKN